MPGALAAGVKDRRRPRASGRAFIMRPARSCMCPRRGGRRSPMAFTNVGTLVLWALLIFGAFTLIGAAIALMDRWNSERPVHPPNRAAYKVERPGYRAPLPQVFERRVGDASESAFERWLREQQLESELR